MRDTAFQAMIPVGLIIDTVNVETDKIMVTARADGTSAACPDCGWSSTQVHSRYCRRLLDL